MMQACQHPHPLQGAQAVDHLQLDRQNCQLPGAQQRKWLPACQSHVLPGLSAQPPHWQSLPQTS